MENRGQYRKKRHAARAEEDARAKEQLEVAIEEKEREAQSRRDAGKASGPPAPPAGQLPQPSSEAQGKGPGAPAAWSATQNQGASSAEGSRAVNFEEAEVRL
eukprot:12799188-Heterocapsa_arctica.AAC.1